MKAPQDLELDREVAKLPRSMRPERDLWTDIERRIVAVPPSSWLGARHRTIAVASGAAFAAAAAVTLLVERREDRSPSPSSAPSAVAASSALPAVLASSEHGLERAKERSAYRAAARSLEGAVTEHLRDLPSRDAERLQQSLGELERAIAATESGRRFRAIRATWSCRRS
jgi:hypothetical protein